MAEKARPAAWRTISRGAGALLLLFIEIAVLDANYSLRVAVAGAPPAAWLFINNTLQAIFYAGLYAGVAFCVLVFAQTRAIATEWIEAARAHRWGRWLAAQLAMLALLLAALPAFQTRAEAPPWIAFGIWLAGCGVLLASAALTLAPFSFWRTLATRNRWSLALAAAAGALTWGAVELSQNSWRDLSAAALYATHWLLSLYEPSVHIEPATRILGAGEFRVIIGAPCSGYEGVGLVLMMLGFYIFAFRRDLRFPHVLALLPIGAATIWLLNIARLAGLISLGAHVSPDLALNGFHSQAGWVMFLVVSIAMMTIAHTAPIFRANPAPRAKSDADPALHLAAAMLAPFALLMAGRIGAAVFGEGARWAGPLFGVLPLIAIWAYRDTIRTQLARINFEPVLIGLAVGALWIATEPARYDNLAYWLADLPPGGALAWLALRIIGFALIVPIAEELVFRGYLHRALIGRRFEHVAPHAFSWTAFVITSLLFGAMHGRWLAGALAGAAFAITLYRSKTLAGPIAAHVAANGLIAACAVAMGRWELL
jgi:exosortase E/protease (VPEID-CTERM system)